MRRFLTPRALSAQIESWMLYWFCASPVVVLYEAAFLYFRPKTLPDGSWGKFFSVYKLVIEVDKRYGDVNDSLVYTTMIMNVIEVLLQILAIYLNHKKSLHTKPLAFTVSVMTFWKTVLYIITFYAGDQDLRKNNTVFEEITMMLLPSMIWVVVPLMCVLSLWQDYLHDYSKKRY